MATVDEWQFCYPSKWKGLIVPESVKHPAKFSSRLISNIYLHMIQEGWLQRGDIVLDPFGGVALGAFNAMIAGFRWRGVELEAPFAKLGNDNIALWNKRFSRMPHFCKDAILYQGDSRKLLEILQAADGAVSSPPYAEARIGQESGQEQCGRGDQYGATAGQLGAMKGNGLDAALSSPPYGGMPVEKNSKSINRERQYEVYKAGGGGQSFEAFCRTQDAHSAGYGTSDGQMAHMPTNDFDSAVSSPPFLQARGGTPEPKGGSIDAALYQRHSAGNASAHGYGETEGQLSSMQDRGFDSAVSSPPYTSEQVAIYGDGPASMPTEKMQDIRASGEWEGYNRQNADNLGSMKGGDFDAALTSPPYESTRAATDEMIDGDHSAIPEHIDTYGSGSVRRDQESVDDFWLSARQIVDQVFIALRPGAHAVWVVKAFVKDKAIVDFPNQWRMLCEAAGFVTLHEHHAMLTKYKGTSRTLDGDDVRHKTEAKSFFRRNGEQKSRAAKWWDTSGLSRECKADWLWAANDLKWRQYHQDVAKHPDRKIKKPKAFIILGKAQMMAYEDAGSPDIEIETSIDYETVWCMQKPVEAQ